MLIIDSLSLGYGKESVVSNLSIEFEPGRRYGLVGINGAGKSTLLRSLSGALKPRSGTITVAGSRLYSNISHNDALRHISFMPQSVDLPSGLRVEEFVRYLTWLRGVNHVDAARRVRAALERVHLTEVATIRLKNLSGGMLRRVALAQALAAEPDVLILDEPSTALDPKQRRIMVDILTSLDDTLVILSSHVMEDVEEVADVVVVLDEGQIKFSGTIDQLAANAPKNSTRPIEDGFLAVIAPTE